MNNEIRSGRLIGYIFAIPCIPILAFSLYASLSEPTFLLVSFFFAIGSAVGISLLRNPKLLVRIKEGKMELYPGSLFGNAMQVKIPIEEIDDLQVHTVSVSNGTSWFLTLHLNKAQELSESTKKLIRTSTRFSKLKNAPEDILHWSLSWPEGGVKQTETKLKMLTSRSEHRQGRAHS